MKNFFSRYGRWVLLAFGLGALVLLVHKIGPEEVWATIKGAGKWLPLIFFLDLMWLTTEGIALLLIYGADSKKVSPRDWFEATLVQYTTLVVLPVGRAGAEVARAALMSRRVGNSRAAAGAALMQSFTLMTNALVTGICLFAVLLTVQGKGLSLLLSLNALMTFALGAGVYLVMKHVKIGGALGRKFKKLSQWGPELDEHFSESRGRHLGAIGFCLLGRSVQTLQYGLILYAVTGAVTLSSALVAQGIQLVGRGLGDMVPNQVGVTEGAFAAFAGALNLAEHPEKAVSIALLGRVSNLSVAGLCALTLQFLPRRAVPEAKESASPLE
jgi:hypothetical protein